MAGTGTNTTPRPLRRFLWCRGPAVRRSPRLSRRRDRRGREQEQICSWQRTTLQPATAGCSAGIGPAPPESEWAMPFLILDPILRFAGHDPPDTTPWIGNITDSAWNDMDVSVLAIGM